MAMFDRRMDTNDIVAIIAKDQMVGGKFQSQSKHTGDVSGESLSTCEMLLILYYSLAVQNITGRRLLQK